MSTRHRCGHASKPAREVSLLCDTLRIARDGHCSSPFSVTAAQQMKPVHSYEKNSVNRSKNQKLASSGVTQGTTDTIHVSAHKQPHVG